MELSYHTHGNVVFQELLNKTYKTLHNTFVIKHRSQFGHLPTGSFMHACNHSYLTLFDRQSETNVSVEFVSEGHGVSHIHSRFTPLGSDIMNSLILGCQSSIE